MIEYAEDDDIVLDADLRAVVISALEAALAHEGRSGDASVLITTPDGIRSLNRTYRHIDAETDVLTFPAWEGEALLAPPDGYLGDVAICLSRAGEQAKSYGHTLRRELAFLAVHGALHLLGYDHMNERDEAVMQQKQDEILNEMGICR